MAETISIDRPKNHSKLSDQSIWGDKVIAAYYSNYFNNLTSKQLDREFNNNILALIKTLNNLSGNSRQQLIDILAREIEFYLKNKIEKELELSFDKLLKF